MKQENFRILFFIAKKRLLRNGEAPVYLRVTVNGIPDYVLFQNRLTDKNDNRIWN